MFKFAVIALLFCILLALVGQKDVAVLVVIGLAALFILPALAFYLIIWEDTHKQEVIAIAIGVALLLLLIWGQDRIDARKQIRKAAAFSQAK